MIDENNPEFKKFCARRERLIKAIIKDQEEQLQVKILVEFEEAMQHFSDKHNLIITAVPVEGKGEHFCFTPTEKLKLSDVIFPREFLEEGER